jgi:hypothetical protein
MKLMAIDPGLKGGLAIFDDERLVAIDPMPVWKTSLSLSGKIKSQVDILALKKIVMQHDINAVVTEYQRPMPGQSSVGTATSFLNWGLVLSLRSLAALHVVDPRVWKKHHGLDSSKTGAIKRAVDLFGPPIRSKLTDGEAEAMLIGHYWLTEGSERERAYMEKQRTRPKRRKRTAARQPASALKRPGQAALTLLPVRRYLHLLRIHPNLKARGPARGLTQSATWSPSSSWRLAGFLVT